MSSIVQVKNGIRFKLDATLKSAIFYAVLPIVQIYDTADVNLVLSERTKMSNVALVTSLSGVCFDRSQQPLVHSGAAAV